MDGATPLIKNGIKPTEAVWFVSLIKKRLTKNCSNVIEKLNKISLEAIEKLKCWNFPVQDKYMPSAGLAWIELKENTIVAHTIGDCEVTFRLKNGEIKRVVQPELIALDEISVKEMVHQAKENNISVRESRKLIDDILIKHRMMMNKENGYNVFTPSEKPNFTFSSEEIKTQDIEEIYIYTDGLSQAFDELKIFQSHKEMFSQKLNLDDVVKQITQVSFYDKDFNLYPRFKKIDDIAAIKITL